MNAIRQVTHILICPSKSTNENNMNISNSFTKKNNFTLLRLLAAMSVLYGHSYALSIGVNGLEDPLSTILITYWGESLPNLAVDLFFVVSGFLVTASYCQRNNFYAFSEARLLRIFPGLIVAIFFCVFIVGPLSIKVQLSDYFTSPTTWAYIKHNIILLNGIQFDLPHVFMSNPYPMSVNGSLWTLPIEFWMYIFIAILGLSSILSNRAIYNAVLLFAILLYSQTNSSLLIFHDQRTAQLGLLFFLGGFFYINKKEIPFGFKWLAILALLTFLTKGYGVHIVLKAALLAYFILIIALHPWMRLPSIDRYGDISYGLYIYAFPVQQLLAQFIPGITPLKMIFCSLLITIILAYLSWRYIEKPALSLKGKMPFGKHKEDVRL